MPVSEARKKANKKYTLKAYDSIVLRVKKGKKEQIKAVADNQGQSLNGFINSAIDEKIERDS